MTKVLLIACLVLAFPAAASAQWADPAGTGGSSEGAALEVVAAPALELALEVDTSYLEEEPAPKAATAAAPLVEWVNPTLTLGVHPPDPCNILKGCGLAPGQTIVPPLRVDAPCNPYRLDDPCNPKPPPGAVIVNPPRPGIPCGYAKPC